MNGFRDLVAAEWIKFWSLRSTPWACGLAVLFFIGAAINSATDRLHYVNPADRWWATHYDPLWDAFPSVGVSVLVLITGSLGALMLAGEYGTGLMRTTLAAVPARRSVIAAKAAVLAPVMLGVGLAAGGLAFWSSQAILSSKHSGISIGHPGALRALLGFALYVPVSALIGLGIAALIRHTAGSVLATVGVLLLLPLLIDSSVHRWTADLHNALPGTALSRLSTLNGYEYGHYPPTLTGSWVVYAAWSFAAILAAVIVVKRRDP
ncbi:ABC transporter permease [Actinoplanes sp. NPDC051343]|uniref:ABC transporter permease n=1 Tax=Actinoplanes sp. NPDC051343 TaxID=3363906 RepID=UPI003798625C